MKIWQQDVIKLIYFTRKKIALSALLFLAMVPKANSATVEVTTEFIADLQQPQKNAFVNTTQLSGFCADFPTQCRTGEFSILIPGLTAEKYLDYMSGDLARNHVSIVLDGAVRDVVLIDVKTNNEIKGRFRLAFFGMRHARVDESSGNLFDAMSGTGRSPQGGCEGRIGFGLDGKGTGHTFGWGVPDRRLTCYKKLNNERPEQYFQGDVHVSYFSFGYTLETPDPLNVYSGEYEGEVVYTVGDGGDINFNAESTSDTEIRIKIKASVRHAFQLKFPSDGDIKVSLAPRGGWSQWTNGGRVPDSLNKEIPFTLSSTSGFTVNMTCTIPSGTGCGLRNDGTGEDIPLDVSLTLPGFKTDGGSEVRNLLLNSLPAGHVIVPPGEFVVNRRSQVDFKVMKPGVETMMKSPGSVWKGDVTLIFDTQMD